MLDDGPLLEDTTASIKLLGTEATLVPFAQHTSAQRMSMSAQHIAHSLPPSRPEHPYIFTGYESVIGRYDFNSTKRKQGIYIIDAIPKYPENMGALQIKVNPMYTVIYVGKEDGKISYFNMERYGKCADGYGYKNEWMNTNLLQSDMYIEPDEILSRSTAHIGANGYGMGVNCNVAYMTLPGVNNDAFIISDRIAEKFTTTAVSSISGDIYPDQLPVNVYGDESEHKFMPDIGERVGDHGIICGFRNPTDSTITSDLLSLDTPYPQCDDLYYAPPKAEIIDVEFYAGVNKNKIKVDQKLFSQVDKYLDPMNAYWTRIVQVYDKLRVKQYGISPEFNTLVTRAMCMLLASGKRLPHFTNKRMDVKLAFGKENIDFIRFKITYAYERPLQLGFKLSDGSGTQSGRLVSNS